MVEFQLEVFLFYFKDLLLKYFEKCKNLHLLDNLNSSGFSINAKEVELI
jgi:hypothetical protein